METKVVKRKNLEKDIRNELPNHFEEVTVHDCTRCNLGEALLRETLKDFIVPKDTVLIFKMNPGKIVLREGESILIPLEIPTKIIQIDKKSGSVSFFKGGVIAKILRGGL